MMRTGRVGKLSASDFNGVALSKANIIANRKQKRFPRSVKAVPPSLCSDSAIEKFSGQGHSGAAR
jgi:hypothetical protein